MATDIVIVTVTFIVIVIRRCVLDNMLDYVLVYMLCEVLYIMLVIVLDCVVIKR